MNSKYTWEDGIISYMTDRTQSIAVELRPLDPADGGA